ncbi:MAG: dephospho-CoA kinase [Burkholderiales bacterium]|nr:dephospho-CoA kinase [Burkholderiales bacterium]
MRVVGLTGGIGSGKSTVAELFVRHGAALVDTDEIAHAISASGGIGAQAIAHAFGADFLDATGAIDRAKLRALVFGNDAARAQLNGVLHPLIRQEAMRRLAALPATAPYAILAVPLLFETNAYADVMWRALVVDCPEAMQIARVKARNQLDDATIRRIMEAQLPRQARLAQADDVIVNDGDLAQLADNVKKLHEIYAQAYE